MQRTVSARSGSGTQPAPSGGRRAAGRTGGEAGPGPGSARGGGIAPGEASAEASRITLFLCGDVMTGRGVDQILRHPGDPSLFEPSLRSAMEYVQLAERKTGPLPRRVDPAYVWGDALGELQRRKPDVRIVNLETAVTVSDEHWRHKDVCYRMHPANVACLGAAAVDCCVLANNHVLDWGQGWPFSRTSRHAPWSSWRRACPPRSVPGTSP